MSDNFLGEIRMFGGGFAIRNWALCDGQVMAISQSTALFSLIGTTYGGNGVQTFGLPDLRGRLPMGQGQGQGLSNRAIGEQAGSEGVTLILNQLPSHSHSFSATTTNASTSTVGPTVLTGQPTAGTSPKLYATPGAGPLTQVQLDPGAVGPAGNSQPHSNLMPSLCVTFIIALTGIFPSRN